MRPLSGWRRITTTGCTGICFDTGIVLKTSCWNYLSGIEINFPRRLRSSVEEQTHNFCARKYKRRYVLVVVGFHPIKDNVCMPHIGLLVTDWIILKKQQRNSDYRLAQSSCSADKNGGSILQLELTQLA